MPPAVVAIAATVATVAVQTFVTNAIIAAILTIAISVAATLLVRRPKGRTNQGQELKLKLDPTMPRQLALGRCATGGSVVWAFTYGTSSGVPGGRYLVRIIALCDLPIEGNVQVYEGKKLLVFTGDPTTGWVQCTNSFQTDGGQDRMWVRVYKGSNPATADANLITWSGGEWTAQHKGTNMAYAIVRYEYDPDGNAFPNGEPQLVWVFDGVKVYDDRYDDTKPNRTGLQRVNDPNTWEYRDNTAILIAQCLRGFYSNGVLLYGAEAEERDLDDAMLISAYNTSDEVVAISGGTQPRYEAGLMVNTVEPLAVALEELQAAMDGRIIDRGGAITIRPGATHTPVFDLDDDDIVWVQQKSWQPKATLSELYNHVAGVFVDSETVFQEKAFPPLRNAQWETDDGGERLTQQVGFQAVTNWARVQRITKRIHQSSRHQGTIAFVMPLWGLEMEQDDWFTLTSERWDFVTKYFQAISVDLTTDGEVAVIARETSSTIDGWDPAVDERPRDDNYWNPPIFALPTPTISATSVYRQETSVAGEQFGVAVTLGNLGAGTLAEFVQVEMGFTADLTTAWTQAILPARDHTAEFYGLLPSTDYSVRVRSSDGQVYSDWSAWVSFTTSSSAYNVDVSVPAAVDFLADNGVLRAGEVPKTIVPSVTQGTTNLRQNNDTHYTLTLVGATGSVDDVDGSSTKGEITITDLTVNEGRADLTVTYKGTAQPKESIILRKVSAPTEDTGGSGAKKVDFTVFTAPSTTHTVMTSVGTVTLATGERLVGFGTLSYMSDGDTGTLRRLWTKYQYSPAGANTWTDFGAEIAGSYSEANNRYFDPLYSEWIFEPGEQGFVTTDQAVTGLAAGDYDVRLSGRVDPSTPIKGIGAQVSVEAKV